MNKLIGNIMLIDKMIIFSDYYLDEMIDKNIFKDKLKSDMEYIQKMMAEIFNEYLGKTNKEDFTNFHKMYISTMYRFKHKIKKILMNNQDNNQAFYEAILNEVDEQIVNMRNHSYRSDLVANEGQYVNESEYNLLLQSDEENPVTDLTNST
ncbi:MAG: hypothetical protein MJB14_10975 [Spirochaetes bacterium]|nr:hypothetical protein [Spirochaetota bacterium]